MLSAKRTPGQQMTIRINDASQQDACFVCGVDIETATPFQIFKDGSKKPACPKCIKEHAPDLGTMLERFKAQQESAKAPGAKPVSEIFVNDVPLDKILKDHAEWLLDGRKGKRANLTGADLSGANLRRADLRNANLRGANLSGANLQEAQLDRAWLDDADISGANFRDAKLEQTALNHVKNIREALGFKFCDLRMTLFDEETQEYLYSINTTAFRKMWGAGKAKSI